MRKQICAVLIAWLLVGFPASVSAAPFSIGISLTRPEAGVFCSELIYNNEVVWRIEVLADGAKAVSAGKREATTILIPDMEYGLFSIKINR